ncbi:phosphate ABC transporter permease PstA [Photobacterium leiognathi]|uniref:phosphate ABC transporter permease PstA n=1 Tax=Photobacterium leiognathi TaxID=553611 RepID=UPI00298167E6|nr:phosphate ABC transporter permease PstA [Photobacterium leiognathi]
MIKWFKSGSPWIWVTAGAVSISLVAVLGLLLLIGYKGLSYFWPSPVYQFDIDVAGKTQTVIGELYDSKAIPLQQLREAGVDVSQLSEPVEMRYLIKTGNRERSGSDFITVLNSQIKQQKIADNIAVVDRETNGKFYGYPMAIIADGVRNNMDFLPEALAEASSVRKELKTLQSVEVADANWHLEKLRLEKRQLALKGKLTSEEQSRIERDELNYNTIYKNIENRLFALQAQLDSASLLLRDSQGKTITVPMSQVLDIWYPNNLTFVEKFQHWGSEVYKFLTEAPREANTEGGVFPAIFGTVFMVLLMSVMVTPLGVLAAIYLHEYAGNNSFTKLIRVAVINLAGVPSIVYGVFGLGFFVYMVGGTIDDVFFSAQLPTPTFGTPGILWSALTLAIMTLPVVIVSTEEGLSRIPSSIRNGSLALGATQAETLWRIVLPMASPAIMTGLILAVARAAGEVAPLMLVGVVKMAPTLPVDAHFPFVHLDRKFMHLGYHIYDVAFQSPNVEAARPLVYATSFLLVTVIVSLNLTAIGIRNHLREKFRALEQ